MKCPECKGEGKTTTLDVMQARSVTKRCSQCGGTGELDKEKDGLYVERIPGTPFWFQWYENDSMVSWAKIRVIPAMQYGKRHLTIEIDHIETRKQDRRKGFATMIVERMKRAFDGEVKYIITGWHDSSAESRGMLTRAGFKREGAALVWRREKK